MAHVPHVYLPPPWDEGALTPDADREHHLRRVLRIRDGETVAYTDGAGRLGEGIWSEGRIVRGAERLVERPMPWIEVAVAPPRRAERMRFLVEKLGELGVDQVTWLATRHGEGRPPKAEKVAAWLAAALEQSRGAWMTVAGGPATVADVATEASDAGRVLVAADTAVPTGGTRFVGVEGAAELLRATASGISVLVGPEGGWAPQEIPDGVPRWSLLDRILRVETAAVTVAVALCLGRETL